MNNHFFRMFSHVYCEKDALEYDLAQSILNALPEAKIILVNHYKDFFNRPGQSFSQQKKSRKLVLAVKKDRFLYEGSPLCHGLDNYSFYYTAPVINCIYDCEFCYLQGIYPSANLVAFVNTEDFFNAVVEKLEDGPLYLPVSYDTDLLALEKMLGLCRRWIGFAGEHKELFIEIRTKSAAYGLIRDIPAAGNVLLSWTFSPDSAVKLFEHGTPSFKQRLTAASCAIRDGWKVRICIDPVLLYDNWNNSYKNMIDEIFDSLKPEQVFDAVIGSFRVPSDALKKMRRNNPLSTLVYYPFNTENYISSYPDDIEKRLIESIFSNLARYMPENKIKILT